MRSRCSVAVDGPCRMTVQGPGHERGMMILNKLVMTALAGAAALGLVACGGGSDEADAGAGAEKLANGMTVAEQIKARQEGYKSIGGAFKTIREEIKKDEMDMAALETAAATLSDKAGAMETWFPEGTGPDAGVKTEALATIWEDPDGFEGAIGRFKAATAEFETAVKAANLETVRGAPALLGGACKNCHDNYRLDD